MSAARSLRRFGLLLATVLIAAGGLSACSSDSAAAEDAYKIGCPAVDTAVAGGSVANQAAVKALQAAHDSGQLDPEPMKWIEAAIAALTSSDPTDLPTDARTLIVDGCADHGYTLQNLR
jgi:hypothetical protein